MWDEVELLTSDDTGSGPLSFPSREECGSLLYQMHTLVKVASSQQVISNPHLDGQNSSDGRVLVVERTVLVLDHICQSLMLIQFETEVDIVGLCHNGQFLVVGERSGQLHLIHVPSKEKLLTKMMIQPSADRYLDLHLEKENDDRGTYRAFVLTKNGFLSLMHLPLAQTLEVLEKMDLSTAAELQGQVDVCFISTEDYHTAGCLTSVTMRTGNNIRLIIGGVGDCVLSVWDLNTEEKLVSLQNVADSSLIGGAKKLQIVESMLFVLDNENILTQWDVCSLTMTWDCHSVHIEEFLLTSESDFSTVTGHGIADVKIVALTKPSRNEEMRSIMIFSLPAMHQLYSLEVSSVSSLVRSGISTDTIYFLEGIYEKTQKSPGIPVSFVVLRCLTEALPENRLSRLLHKHRFAEAESFAVQFGLDTELVYKVKVSCVLERLLLESVGSDGQAVWLELLVQAKETLDKIKHDQFVVEYCINTPWPSYETTREMLQYAKSRILKRGDSAVAPLSAEDSASLTEVLRAQARLTSFFGAFGLQKFSGNVWLEFLNNEDTFKDILGQLKEDNISSAQYLWLRHQADFKNKFGVEMLEDLLEAIPSAVPLKELCLWFESVIIPFVRQVVPQGQKRIAEWLEREARNLELTDKANWPENGLEVAQVFFTSKTEIDEIGLASSRHQFPWDDCEEVSRLKKLVGALRGLVDLYRKYNCRLALCNFETKSANAIVFHMLDKVLAPELIPTALEKFIEPYMYHYSLQKDEILLQYIQDLLERYCTRSTSVFDTTWEAKAIAVVGCMSSMELILEGVLAIMCGAVVPWSPAVEQLVQQYLNMEHVKAKQLQEGYKLMEMKTLLRNYGIRDTNLLNDKQMMLMVVKYILKQDTPSSLEDALKIANACMLPTAEVYIWRIVNLIAKEEGDNVLGLLKTLPPEEVVEMAERTLIWGRLRLEDQIDDSEEEWKTKLCVKKLCVDILKFLLGIQKENPWKKEECETDLKLFKALAALQEKFNICISAEDYENPSVRSRLFEEHIEAYKKETRRSSRVRDEGTASEGSGVEKPLTYSRLCQLALLLQKTEQEMGSELVLQELEAGRAEEALKICRNCYELHQNEQTGQLLFSGCWKLCHMLGSETPMVVPEGVDLAAVVNNMAGQTATICNPDLLLDAVELCKYTSFAHEISRKCQIEDYGAVFETTSSGADADPYREWTFNDFFAEDGAVLDSTTVLPVAYEASTALVPAAERKRHPLDSTSLAHCPFEQGKNLYMPCMRPVSVLLNSLQECSQLELALGLVTNSFGALCQHTVANNMDISLGEQLHGPVTFQDARRFLLTAMQDSASLVKSIATALLFKVLNSRQADHSLALGYCTLLPQEIAYEKLWEIINNASQNYSKILAVSLVGAQLASLCGESETKQAFEELITDAEWGLQLGQLGISFQKVFRMPSMRKKELLRTLVQHPKVDTALILKYCSTFLLDTDAALQLCIETLLLQTAIACPAEGDPLRHTEAQPQASVMARATEIIPLLKSTSSLVTSLNATLLKLDPYDYEAIESLLTTMEKAEGGTSSISVSRALMLIKHLKSYKRISPPGDLEHQYVSEQGILLSPSAQTRLPFHLIFFRTAQCFWKIVSAELCEESFPKVLLICKLMKISSDMLHMKAAHHVFQEALKPQMLKQTRVGYLSAISQDTAKTMRTIQSYLHSIADPEWAAALAHKIAQEIPTGPIKVQVLKFCLGLVEEWAKKTAVTEESRGKAQALLKKLEVQHQKSATEAVLAAHRLNSEEHQKLVGKPARLVVLLYQHSSIAERFRNPAGRDYPDIHAAAQEIAEINDLDMNKIWDMLLEKWLYPDAQPAANNPDVFESVPEDEDFSRVIYLLQPRPMDLVSRILYECSISSTCPFGLSKQSYANRRRALSCLLCLADASAVESVFKKPMKEVENFLKCLTFLAAFETLNIPYTDESFQRTPKEGMIKGLWKNHNHEPTAVKLVTELSLEYRVYDPVLWNGLLQKLVGFKMIHYLKNVLVEITGVSLLWQIPNFSRAWRSVILAPFLSASCPLSSSQLEACCASFKTLLRCPVLSDIDVTGIANQCAQLDLPALALGCLLLIPQPEQRAQQIQSILASCQLETVLQQVEEHMGQGEVAVFAPQIQRSILDHVVHEKRKGLALTTYFLLLKLQEMDPDTLKGLVGNLRIENRMVDAAAVITEYRKQSGNPADIVT